MTFDSNLVDQSDSTAQILGSNLLRRWSANLYRTTEQFAGVSSLFIPGSGKTFIQQLIAVLVRG